MSSPAKPPSPATQSLKPNAPCPEGQARSLSTGRCRKTPRKCPPGKMRNNATKRCVTTKACPPGRVRNPRSHRCKRVASAASPAKKHATPYRRHRRRHHHTVKSRTPTPGPHVAFKSKVSHIARSRSNRNSKGTITIRHSSRAKSASPNISATGDFAKIKSKLEKTLKFPKSEDVAIDVALEPIKEPGLEGAVLSIHESAAQKRENVADSISPWRKQLKKAEVSLKMSSSPWRKQLKKADVSLKKTTDTPDVAPPSHLIQKLGKRITPKHHEEHKTESETDDAYGFFHF